MNVNSREHFIILFVLKNLGNTAITLAAENNHPDVIKCMIDRGGDINI